MYALNGVCKSRQMSFNSPLIIQKRVTVIKSMYSSFFSEMYIHTINHHGNNIVRMGDLVGSFLITIMCLGNLRTKDNCFYPLAGPTNQTYYLKHF